MTVTLNVMIRQLQGLVGTKDIRPKDDQFIQDMWETTQQATKTTQLTGPQVTYIESLWNKHYG
jgi:hypothetical protein